MNHDQAQAIQQCDHRQQQGVGVRGEAPNSQMRSGEQRQVRDGVLGQVPAQPLFLVGLHEQQRDSGDHRGERQQEQLGVTPVR